VLTIALGVPSKGAKCFLHANFMIKDRHLMEQFCSSRMPKMLEKRLLTIKRDCWKVTNFFCRGEDWQGVCPKCQKNHTYSGHLPDWASHSLSVQSLPLRLGLLKEGLQMSCLVFWEICMPSTLHTTARQIFTKYHFALRCLRICLSKVLLPHHHSLVCAFKTYFLNAYYVPVSQYISTAMGITF
jgi:hypothetical protein